MNRKLEHCQLDVNSVRDLIYGAKNAEKVRLKTDILTYSDDPSFRLTPIQKESIKKSIQLRFYGQNLKAFE